MMRPPPLTSQELEDTLKAGKKGHNGEPIALSSKCHPNTPMIVTYDTELVGLWLVCSVCKTAVTCVAVKPSKVH